MGILFPWFLFYLSVRLYKSELLRKPLGRVQTYVRHVHHAEEPWPRITGSITVPFDHTLGWAGARRFFADPPVLMTGIVILVVLGFFLFDFIFIFFILGVALMLVAIAVHRASHRKRVFVSLFPYALDTLIQALRTGYSFRQAITLVRQETEQPIHEVFAALERGFEYRIPQREVLLALQGDLLLPAWDYFVDTMLIQEKTGGNSVPILEQVAHSLREYATLERELYTATASGRLSSILIAVLVPVVFIFFFIFNPSYVNLFFTSGMGRLLFVSAVVLQAVGFLIIQKLKKVQY